MENICTTPEVDGLRIFPTTSVHLASKTQTRHDHFYWMVGDMRVCIPGVPVIYLFAGSIKGDSPSYRNIV